MQLTEMISSQKLREVAGSFATGITVVCIEDSEGDIRGMTANSFLSVSLDPPLVLFSVRNEGDFLNYCEIGTVVGISVLSEKQKSLSKLFAGQGGSEKNVKFNSSDECHILKGCMAWYRTRIAEIIEVGDHSLIICSVEDLDRDHSKNPLIYHKGYRSVGSEVDKPFQLFL